MSSLAAWSYTAIATLWPLVGTDDWSGAKNFGAPVQFACDYSAEAVRMTDDAGVEFTTRQILHTERSDMKQGDMVLIGTSTLPDPVAAGADEVRSVKRFSDTFQREADDYRIAT
jgi:hypothetical protein